MNNVLRYIRIFFLFFISLQSYDTTAFSFTDNMPVTWCYIVEGGSVFCATGFPVGCFVDALHRPKDACVMDVSI